MTNAIEGVIISPAQYRPHRPLRACAQVAGSDIVTVARVTRHVVAHDTTRAVCREIAYIPGGIRAAWVYYRANYGSARYITQIDAAYTAGDLERAERLTTAMEAERGRRWSRLVDVAKLLVTVVKVFPWLVLALGGCLIGLGVLIAVAGGDASLVWEPFRWIVAGVAFGIWAFTVSAVFLPWVVLGIVVLCLWAAGRRAGNVPEFLAPAAEREATARELIPDEGAILAALKDLGIAKYREKLREGWQARWPLPTQRDGKGYRTQLELPRGVNVKMINDKKDLLAHNLVRLPVEVWPTEPQNQPGVLDLWVADQGLLSGPVPQYPLLKDGVCDYFKGVPVGFDQRGDVAIARLMASNYAIGGTMGSGKSSLVINLLVGAALDPLVDIDVYLMAYNVDYDPFKDRLSTLVKGDEDEHITAAMDGLRDLREEVSKRGKLLDEMGGDETKVTRSLALADSRMRPKVVVFDEVQELMRHEKYGDQAKQLAIKVMTKARKCAITLIWVTPEPSADSLPRELPRVVSHGVCFAINDYIGNDAILGTGSYKRGVSAVDLDPHENIGTAMAFGFGPRPGLLRSCYIRKDATTDQLTPIVQRSLGPWRGALPTEPEEVRDLLDDVHEAFGPDDKVRAAHMADRLRETYPDFRDYRAINGTGLVAQLAKVGVVVDPGQGRHFWIQAARVLRAIDERAGVYE